MVEYTEKAIARKVLWIEHHMNEILKERIVELRADGDYRDGYLDGLEDAVNELNYAFMAYFPELAVDRMRKKQ